MEVEQKHNMMNSAVETWTMHQTSPGKKGLRSAYQTRKRKESFVVRKEEKFILGQENFTWQGKETEGLILCEE